MLAPTGQAFIGYIASNTFKKDLHGAHGAELCAEYAQQQGSCLLSSRAAAAHIQLSAACNHDDAVVIAARRPMIRIRFDLDIVYVLAAVRLLPQLLHDLVDI